MNTISNQIPICPPSRQLIWPEVETAAMNVSVVFDKGTRAGEIEIAIQHAAARALPASELRRPALHGLDSATLHSLVHDAHGAHLENFPFAFSVFSILVTGSTATIWGIILTSAWLTVIGFPITLAGCALYGWSLYDE
jgi:hypothetical protein